MIVMLTVVVLLALLLGVAGAVVWARVSAEVSERSRQELARREDERRLQRLTHLAMAQMFIEARRAGHQDRR